MLVNINILAGLASTLFGLVYTIMAYLIPRATIGNPVEPLIFPMIIGIAMFICGIFLISIESVKIKKGDSSTKMMEIKLHGLKAMQFENRMILLTVGSALIYTIIFDKVGYVLSTTFFLGVMLFAFNGKEKWKVNIIVSVGFSVVVYIIFTKLLSIPLPITPFLYI